MRLEDVLAAYEADRLGLLRDIISVSAVALARPTAMFLVTPFLGRGVLTGLARNGVLAALTIPAAPLIWLSRPDDLAAGGMTLIVALVLKETLIGLLLGLPFAVLSWGLEAAGFMIDNQRGSTMASSLNPTTGEQSSPTGILLAQTYTVWMFATGGFLVLLDLLYRSYGVWPAWGMLPGLDPSLATGMLKLLDRVMLLTVLLAGPALIAMFLSEMGLALVSRFAPQLQVFFLAMPLKSAVGLLVLMLSLGVILDGISLNLAESAGLIGTLTGWLR